MHSVLMKIQSHVKQYIQVIQSFFNADIDVDVCDANLLRIAGTGRFSGGIGQKMTHGKLSGMGIAEKREVFVFNPPREEPCRSCEHLRYCGNYAKMIFPLIGNGEILGAVSITALNPDQSRDLLVRKDKVSLFIRAVCDLIVLKMREYADQQRHAQQLRLQDQLVNAIKDGVMILDSENRILHINRRGESILGCTLQQIRQLTRDRRFSLAQVRTVDAEVEFLLRIRRTKMRLAGHVYEVGDGLPGDVARIFVFVDMRTLRENLLPPGSMVSCTFDSIIGKSAAFLEAVEACRKIAFHSTPALLAGEVAVGKEVFARAIHNEGVFRSNKFIRIAHGGELQDFLDKDKFDRERMNSNDYFFRADKLDGNTLYMDEIGDFVLEDQCIVLALVQRSRQLNIRVICSTSKDLEPMSESGEFHPELFYSLEVYAVTIPPVRSRGNDVMLFVAHYLKAANRQMHRNVLLSKEVQSMFLTHPWRGNVREIENTIAYLVEHAETDDEEITPKILPPGLQKKFAGKQKKDYNLEKAEKHMIVQALNDSALSLSSRSKVAKALGISNATLYRKLKHYGIRQKTKFD